MNHTPRHDTPPTASESDALVPPMPTLDTQHIVPNATPDTPNALQRYKRYNKNGYPPAPQSGGGTHI